MNYFSENVNAETNRAFIFVQTLLSLKLRNLFLSQKEFPHFKFETYH